MQKRKFGRTGWECSEVGLGCWQLGGDCWGDLDDARAMEILRVSAEGGVTFFDTADVYGSGRSEQLLGRFLKQWPERLHVATKLGRRSDPGWPQNGAREVMIRHTEDSLRRLGVETLDLTQLHCLPIDALRDGSVFDTLRDLQTVGKIRHFGASVETVEEGLLCLEQEGLCSLQVIFNIFRQKPAERLLREAERRGVAILVRLPLASGLLGGKLGRNSVFSPADHRSFNRNGEMFNVGETFAGLPYELGVDLAEELRGQVPDGMTLPQMALRWILDDPAVSVIIPGASNPAQAGANVLASDLPPLSGGLHRELRRFYEEKVQAHIRGPY